MIDLLYKDESYKIVGAAYEVFNELGAGLAEKYYQKGLAQKLKGLGFEVEEQVPFEILSDNKSIGRQLLDFVVNKSIVLELKVDNRFRKDHLRQIFAYLKKSNLKLGIILLFTKNEVRQYRVLNS